MNEVVLVVDDEPKIVKQARDYLERSGYRVIEAGDGKTALAQVRHERPDLVVLDLDLPEPALSRGEGMDGLDVCRALRRESDMPIVHVNVWEGFGQKNAKTVIQGITGVFVDLGIPKHAVEVVVHEIPKSHWGVAGEPASERLKDESPPQ